MKPLSWIRWKYAAPLAIVVGALIVFFVLFFDLLLAHTIEKYGSKANGAKVEVSGLKTKLFQGRLSIAHLQVANPDQPMQNRLEVGPMAFEMMPGELLGRRVIIKEATLKGIAFDTPRKTSGALPTLFKKSEPEEPGAAAKLAEKYKDRFKINIDGIKGDVKAKIDFDPKDLEVTKTADGIKQKAQTLPNDWDKRIKDLNVDARLKKAEADLNAIKATPTKGPEAIKAIPEALKKLGQVKSDLDAVKNDVQKTKGDIQSQTNDLKGQANNLSDVKKKDLDGLMSRLNLDFASPERLVEGIIGPLVLSRFHTVMHYIALARQHMPPKKDKEKETLPAKPRAKGMDIEFPTPAALPRFWLMKGALAGVYNAIDLGGEMSNLTTDPGRVGKPFVLNLDGKQGAQAYLAKATLDHTKDVSNDSLILQATGLDVKSLMPADNVSSVDFTKGSANLNLALNIIGDENIGGQIRMGLSGLKLDFSALAGGDKMKTEFLNNVASAVESMKEVVVESQIYGTYNDPSLKITSNLAPVLGNVVKNSVGNLAKDQRKQLEARLDAITSAKQKEVNTQLSGIESKANQQLSGFETEIQKKISEAAGVNLGSGGESPLPGVKLPSIKKLPW